MTGRALRPTLGMLYGSAAVCRGTAMASQPYSCVCNPLQRLGFCDTHARSAPAASHWFDAHESLPGTQLLIAESIMLFQSSRRTMASGSPVSAEQSQARLLQQLIFKDDICKPAMQLQIHSCWQTAQFHPVIIWSSLIQRALQAASGNQMHPACRCTGWMLRWGVWSLWPRQGMHSGS